MDQLKALLAKVATGTALTVDESAQAFDRMMSGEATPSQMGALLMALRVRGETVEEITGAVRTMRAKMLTVAAPPQAMDIVGTGGDASGSYNISTCAAFIVAGVGVPIAKHGNRALSSRCGAADVLGDRNAGAGDDQSGASRDIIRSRCVAAGADHVDRIGRGGNAQHLAAHGRDGAGDLLDGLATHAHCH